MRKFYSLLLLTFLATTLNAQTFTLSGGTSGSHLYNLVYTWYQAPRAQRMATHFPAAQLAAGGLVSGAAINSLELERELGNTLALPAGASIKIYLENRPSTSADLGTGTLTWATIIANATMVFNGDPSGILGNSPGWKSFAFGTGAGSASSFVYSGGALVVYAEYVHTTAIGGSTAIPMLYATSAQASVTPTGWTSNSTKYSNNSTTTPPTTIGSSTANHPHIKLNFTTGPCSTSPTAGQATATATTVCSGVGVTLGLTGNSSGSGQTYQWESSPSNLPNSYTPIGTSSSSTGLTINPTSTQYYRAAVTCSGNTAYSQEILVSVTQPFPAGTYTINKNLATGSGNFHSFTDAIGALGCGIAGPITFDVATGSGPYVEQVALTPIVGASASNTITFDGNGETINTNTLATSSARAAITLSGADYITFNNFNITCDTAAYGWGVLFTDTADHNTISNCTINVSKTASTVNHSGIVMSGSATSATTSGMNGNSNTITGNTIIGGYYGIVNYGSSSVNNLNNTFSNNIIKDFYLYGIYSIYNTNAMVSGNDISRPSRTNTGTASGILFATDNMGGLVEKNRIHNVFDSMTSSTSSFAAIELTADGTSAQQNNVFNNLIYNINHNGAAYGIQSTTAPYCNIYHNTISLDDVSASPSGITYGFYQSGTAAGIRFINNIISISRGGSGAKYCIYKNTAANAIVSDTNAFYLNSAGTGAQNIGYQTSAQQSLSQWTNTSNQDAHSVVADPFYVAASSGNLTPNNGIINDMGRPLGVLTDILNATRSVTTPDVGAYEFSVAACSGTPVAGTAASSNSSLVACPGGIVNLTLTGFTLGQGITIQWESSPAGVGLWQTVNGATGSSYSDVFSGATDYRAVVTCAAGGGTDVSNTVSISANPFYLCYCSPNTNNTLHGTTLNAITNVSIPGTTLNSTTAAVGVGGYSQLDPAIPANTATLTQGQTYTVNASISTATYSTELWIDYDQNGTFDSVEYTLLTPGSVSTASVTVPANAIAGLTGMRVRITTSATTVHGPNGACSNISVGRETEDYVITINPAPPCAGTPTTAGNATVASSSLCNGLPASLSLSGYPIETGIVYQWESSPSGQNNFQPIAGATNTSAVSGPLAANTDFRAAVTCTNGGGGTAYSNIVTVSVENPQPLSIGNGSRCGIGTVALSATPPVGGIINWYTTATGGMPVVAASNNFTTQVLTSTATYYASAISGGTNQYVGRLVPAGAGSASSTSTYGLGFTVTQAFVLNSVDVISTTGTALSINLYNSNGSVQLQTTGSVTVPANDTTAVALGWVLAPGTYRIAATGLTGSFIRETSNVTYPISLGSVGQINGFMSTILGNITTTATYNWFYNWNITTGCVGARVPVIATVNPAPAYTVTATPDTICQGSSSTIAVNSANAYTYTWTPGGAGNSISVTPATTTKYFVSGIDNNSCAIYDSVTVAVKSVLPTATVASVQSVCVSGNVDLSLNPVPVTGITIQWQKNTGTGFTDINGATGATLTESVTANVSYQAKLYCGGNLIVTSTPASITYSNPSVVSTVPGSRCGTGPVTLLATPSAGATIKWYNVATGGTAVGTGNAFTTPSLNTTTSFWASALNGAGSLTAGRATPFATSTGFNGNNYGMVFDATQAFTLTSVDVYPTTATGVLSVQLVNGSGTVLQTAGPFTLPAATGTTFGGGATPYTLNLNFNITPGTDYKIATIAHTGSIIRDNPIGTNFSYPLPIGTVGNITSGWLSGSANANTYYYFYNWQVNAGCEGTRVPVTATINGAASGTGLSTGGTTVVTNQADGTTVDYMDACNDKVVTVVDAAGGNALGNTGAIVLTSPTVPTLGTSAKPYVPRAFDITPSSNGPATVTLYALQSEFNAYNSYVTTNSLSLPLLPTSPTDVAGIANIVVTQYHGAASAGSAGPGGLYANTNVELIPNSAITALSNGTYWTLTFPVTGFSGFFIHTGSTPLSIELKSISATNVGSRNRVDWTTGAELPGDKFDLERSINGSDFSRIATISANGKPSSYSYWDENPVTGINYYRIRMTDAAGKASYSRVVNATVKSGTFTVEAYPNPVSELLTVKAYGSTGTSATVTITDVTGKVVKMMDITNGMVQVNMSGLAQGMYLVKYHDSENMQTIKVNKQ